MVIEFYKAEDGSRPAKEYIESLEPSAKAGIFGELDLLEEQGESLKEPHMMAHDGGIYELSTRTDGIKYAIYLFFTPDGSAAILTSGHTLTEYEAFKLEQLQTDLVMAGKYAGILTSRESENTLENVLVSSLFEAPAESGKGKKRPGKATTQEIEQAKECKAEYMKQHRKR